ncbi:MAG: DUF1194 domain-containing protein [Alphaproteobacteria bacterium]|nr:DUF1194 domain-containing protein [Alphaproteobacteria bacterium]
MLSRRTLLASAAATSSLVVRPAAAATAVDLELVLAVDVSGSVDWEEYALQRQGYADAFRNPRLHQAIRGGPIGRIAVIMTQWAGFTLQSVAVPWTLVDSAASAVSFADAILEAPRYRLRGTSLSGALLHATRLFGDGFEGSRQVIDVSGDGPNNSGPEPDTVRDLAVAAGITINGLPILTDLPWLGDYFRSHVIGGPGAFIEEAVSFEAFGAAVLRKLLAEVSGLTPHRFA